MIAQIINSFTYNQTGGNPAGVVVDFDNVLKGPDMQAIAKKLALSETAFITRGHGNADFHIRFFTPTDEVDLCGHATIASFWHLVQIGKIQTLRTSQITKAGLLAVELMPQPDGSTLTFMEQMTPLRINPLFSFKEALTDTFSNSKLSSSLPVEIWSTGLKDIMMPVASREALNSLTFDYDKLTLLSKKLDVVGVHAFAIEGDAIYARNFAPRYGINEESATGTSNGALTAYLQKYIYQNQNELSLMMIQGEAMGKSSAIFTRWHKGADRDSIWVGGYCILMDEILL